MDLISVIIPYYKKENFIKFTIKSILNQTYKKFEIIIIDDETTEKSKTLLNKISRLDKRIKIFKNSRNMGAGYSRNYGIKKAQGSFIAFCDSDDLWDRSKLQFQIVKMKEFNLKISSTNYKIIDENGKYLGLRKSSNNLTYKKLINSCDIGLSTVIAERSLFKKKKI
jgi:teichuronic acid biosynthesis glycosyltransferase TuaG